MINILMVDDHILVRDSISKRIALEKNINIVGHAADGREAIQKSQELQPDIVIMDISMPVMDGFEATKKITKGWPNIKVMILSMHDEPEYAQKLMQSRASGYALKDISVDELLTAINTVHQGGRYISQDILKHLISPPNERQPLTDRERIILCCIANGLPDKEIARELDISVRTVETHKQNIKSKLGIRTIAGLTLYAFKNGLII